jgi:phage terminase large subunit
VQREYRKVYRYPNGSEITVGGMDRPGRILSAEYDIIYAAEAVQLDLEDWETLVMRNRSTVVPFQQVIGDTNPDRPDHWIKQRADEGLVTLLNTYHEDNPKYWDGGDWTWDGRNYVIGKLDRLTGVRRARYRDGKWVIAEGAIYDDWRADLHVIDRFEIPAGWRRFRAVDFGYTNAFVCQWWAVDTDGRLYLYREIYYTRRLVEDHAAQINALSVGEKIEATVTDHDAEDRATLERYGIRTTAADKNVSAGLQAVQSRLRVQGDGRARLYIFRDALVSRDPELAEAKLPTSTIDEIPGYVWNDRKTKEEPVKENDHGVDAMRYAVMYLDAGAEKTVMRRGRAKWR